jgi:hypothetical protein
MCSTVGPAPGSNHTKRWFLRAWLRFVYAQGDDPEASGGNLPPLNASTGIAWVDDVKLMKLRDF